MRHPAFDTGTDIASRKAATEKEDSKNEQQQQQKNQSKDQQASQSQQTQPQATGASSQASSNQSAVDASNQLSTQVDLNKTPSAPATSADVAAQLSATQQALSAVDDETSAVSQAEKIADDVNKMLSSICEPIYKALDNLKKLPPKLNKMVDVEGAKKGMYKQLDAFEDTWKKPYTVYVSVDVPITLDDYGQAPYKYPNLASIQRLTNTITEADCLSSGYKKTIISSYTELSVETNENFQNPTDQSITAKTCEKSLAVATKTAWATIKPAISQIAGVAGFDQINGMMDSALEMIDGVVKLAETPVPEEKLNQKIREMQVGAANLANESANAKNAENTANQTNDERIKKAKENAKKTKEKLLKEVQSVKETSSNAFANMKMPPLPDGIDESLRDIWEAILNIVMNIQNLFIVVLFKLIEAVFKCLNQILGAIGVPTIPSPLNALPQLIVNAIDIMMFILGLPMSLVNQIKAIVKRKAKAVVVSQMPPPPKPVPEVVAIAPTSDDVPKPDLTWKDVQDALKKKWHFGTKDSLTIVENLQKFFDGSDLNPDDGSLMSTKVYVETIEVESPLKEDAYDEKPSYKNISRSLLTPESALEQWLPSNIQSSFNGYEQHELSIPIDASDKIFKFAQHVKYTKGKLAGQILRQIKSASMSWELTTFEST